MPRILSLSALNDRLASASAVGERWPSSSVHSLTASSSSAADLGADLAELRRIGRDGHVAQGGENIAAADGKAVDAGDHGLGNVADDRLEFVNRQADDAAAIILAVLGALVAAGAEGLVAGAGQHHARHPAVIGGQLEGRDHFLDRLRAEGVVQLGPVDDDPGGPAADFIEDVFELGGFAHGASFPIVLL